MKSVIIVGAGLSGLALAYRIRQRLPSCKITILEAENRIGGKIGTDRQDGFVVERGPNGIFDAKPHMLRLCRDLGLGQKLIVASEASRKNRFVYLNDKLQQLPGSLMALLRTRLLTTMGKTRLMTEPFRRKLRHPTAEESIAAFATRRFGREVAATFIDALVTGIHAGDPEKLSVQCALPRLAMFEELYGSVVRGVLASAKQRRRELTAKGEQPGPQRMWSFEGGLQVLIDRLTDELQQCLVTGVVVKRICRHEALWKVMTDGLESYSAETVVFTTPAPNQAESLADLDESIAIDLASIKYNSVPVVALGYRNEDAPIQPDGFGYIAPQRTRRPVLGVQWCSSIYPGRAPKGCVMWRALCGGTSRPDVANWKDEELVRNTHQELKLTMGVTGDPVFSRVVRWPQAIPQYEVGHLARRERIMSRVNHYPGLYLAGSSYFGVAMNDCAEQAELLASRLA